jgi:hypothetical protein
MMVRMAVTTHAPRKSAGELVPRAISASTIKMPEPIIDPITSAVELNRPRLWISRGGLAASSVESGADPGDSVLELGIGFVT